MDWSSPPASTTSKSVRINSASCRRFSSGETSSGFSLRAEVGSDGEVHSILQSNPIPHASTNSANNSPVNDLNNHNNCHGSSNCHRHNCNVKNNSTNPLNSSDSSDSDSCHVKDIAKMLAQTSPTIDDAKLPKKLNKTKHVEEVEERETWDKKTEFLLAVIGFAVDLGNVWRFPFICYRNGGGAFLIPWMIMFLFGGLPLFYLELALGQYYRNGCLTLWKRVCPIMKGIGYAICFTDLYMAMYYNTIIAWAVYYLIASFTTELPWTRCDNSWNTPNCMTLFERSGNVSNATSPAEEFFERQVLQIHMSTGFDAIGPIKWSLAMCLLAVFIVVYFSLWKGVKSSGKAVWITATMPYFVLFALLIRGVTLEGSMDGIRYYLYPQWDKLAEVSVWIDAATQIFFSLGPGFGTLLALSSYNKFTNNCYRDAIFTSTVNCLTSFVAGFVIFSVLGYMAAVLKKDIATVAADGPGLVFVVYPEALAAMSGSTIWSILFFIMLITLGIDSTFGGLEAMITGLCDEYPHLIRKNREIFVGVLLIFIFICALPTTTYGGNYVVMFLDAYGTSLTILFIVFIEAVAICWFYGADRFSDQIEEMLGSRPGIFWRICWKYITPVILFVISITSVVNYQNLEFKNEPFPWWSIPVGWLVSLSSLACIPAYAAYLLCKTEGSFVKRLVLACSPQILPQESHQHRQQEAHQKDHLQQQTQQQQQSNVHV